MEKRKVYMILLVLLPLLAVILTAMPGAMVMRFYAGPGNGYFLREVSGFARVLIGYAQPFPFMAGTSAIVTVIFALRGPDIRRVRSFAAAGAVFWCIAGIMGGFTGYGIGAMALLAVTAGLAQWLSKEERA